MILMDHILGVRTTLARNFRHPEHRYIGEKKKILGPRLPVFPVDYYMKFLFVRAQLEGAAAVVRK